jgi:hypothetical protein
MKRVFRWGIIYLSKICINCRQVFLSKQSNKTQYENDIINMYIEETKKIENKYNELFEEYCKLLDNPKISTETVQIGNDKCENKDTQTEKIESESLVMMLGSNSENFRNDNNVKGKKQAKDKRENSKRAKKTEFKKSFNEEQLQFKMEINKLKGQIENKDVLELFCKACYIRETIDKFDTKIYQEAGVKKWYRGKDFKNFCSNKKVDNLYEITKDTKEIFKLCCAVIHQELNKELGVKSLFQNNLNTFYMFTREVLTSLGRLQYTGYLDQIYDIYLSLNNNKEDVEFEKLDGLEGLDKSDKSNKLEN